MKPRFNLLTVTVVVAVGGYLCTQPSTPFGAIATMARTGVSVMGVRNDLLALADAERRFYAVKSRYGTLRELKEETGVFIPDRPEYIYISEANEMSFRITALNSGSDPNAPDQISIDERMRVVE